MHDGLNFLWHDENISWKCLSICDIHMLDQTSGVAEAVLKMTQDQDDPEKLTPKENYDHDFVLRWSCQIVGSNVVSKNRGWPIHWASRKIFTKELGFLRCVCKMGPALVQATNLQPKNVGYNGNNSRLWIQFFPLPVYLPGLAQEDFQLSLTSIKTFAGRHFL